MSSTALVGLAEGARYLVEYPYGCAEQKSSRALAMLLAADLGDTFTLPGMDTSKMRPAVQQALKELERFQCESGGFAYWPGACESVSPYLTAYLLQVMKTASDLKYDVDRGVRERAYTYLRAATVESSAEQCELASCVHRVAGVRRQGAGRGRTESGLEPDSPLRLPRSDAGVRARVSARRTARERRDRRAISRCAAG